MPDDFASDEAIIENAHKALDKIYCACNDFRPLIGRAEAEAALIVLVGRFLKLREERQDAEDMLAHAQELVAPVVSGALELDSFFRYRGAP